MQEMADHGPAAANHNAARPDDSPPRRPARAVTRGWRRWALRLLLVVLSPVLFFALLEGALRLVGYGYATSFFLRTDQAGIYTTNRRFSLRYFPPALARAPVPTRFASPKPAGTYRIFILGESAAQGFPDTSTAFGRVLEVMLRTRYPNTRFEVINAAVTAINSHAVADIARDCAQHQPDLFVIYMGNNEVIGPFGPGTVFAQFSPDLGAIRASLWLKTLRSGQFFSDLLGRIGRSKQSPRGWAGMEMFVNNRVAADAPTMDAVYSHFEHNLRSIIGSAQAAGAKTIVCTVAVNLKDCAPFASLHKPGLSDTQRKQWEDLYREANRLQDAGDHAKAAAQHQLALNLDDQYAELHYRLAQSLLALHAGQPQPPLAIAHLERARDLDALRFRTDSRLNQTIRQVAQSLSAGNDSVYLVDAERAFAQASARHGAPATTPPTTTATPTATAAAAAARPTTNSIPEAAPGADLFYEHVHFRFAGSYALAASVYQQIVPILPDWVRKQAAPPSSDNPPQGPPSREQCAAALGFTDLLHHAQVKSIQGVMARPPFTSQCDHAQRLAAIDQEARALSRRLTSAALVQVSQIAQDAVRQNPDDPHLRQHLGQILLRRGMLDNALRELTRSWQLLPEEVGALPHMAQVKARQELLTEAEGLYRRYLDAKPADYEVRVDLLQLLVTQRRFADALSVADDAQPWVETGLHPYLRAQVRRAEGNLAEAEAEARRAVDAAPNRAGTYIELGLALQPRSAQAAATQFRKALEVDPRFVEAYQRLAELAVRTRDWPEASEHIRAALVIDPEASGLNQMLGRVMLQQGAAAQAVQCFREEMRVSPGWPIPMRSLAWLLAAHPDDGIRNGREALALAEQLAALMPAGDPQVLDLMAAAYAETGRFPQAAALAEQAVRAAGAQELARQITERRELYRANKPYRHPTPGLP